MKIEGIIFDLDETLVDTQAVLPFREGRNWGKAIRNLHQTTVYPGVKEMLKKLSKSNIKYGIVTSSPRKYAESVVSFHELRMPVLVAYQDTRKHKPNPDPILKGVEKLNVDIEDVIFVGDNDLDIIAGNAAGVLTALSTWSIHDNTCEVRADIILDNPLKLVNSIADNNLFQIKEERLL